MYEIMGNHIKLSSVIAVSKIRELSRPKADGAGGFYIFYISLGSSEIDIGHPDKEKIEDVRSKLMYDLERASIK